MLKSHYRTHGSALVHIIRRAIVGSVPRLMAPVSYPGYGDVHDMFCLGN